jgi:hypothetical protein
VIDPAVYAGLLTEAETRSYPLASKPSDHLQPRIVEAQTKAVRSSTFL